MKSITALLFAASLTAASAETLLEENSFEKWTIKGPTVGWTIKDGVLTGTHDPDKKGSILWTKKHYGNFTLTGEFRFSGNIDSGVFLRNESDQIQIGTSSSLKRDMTASPYIGKLGKYPVEAEGVAKLLKEGEWNTFSITAKGPQYLVTLNGTQVLDFTSESASEKGPIGLQVHPGNEMTIDFRALEIEEIAD